MSFSIYGQKKPGQGSAPARQPIKARPVFKLRSSSVGTERTPTTQQPEAQTAPGKSAPGKSGPERAAQPSLRSRPSLESLLQRGLLLIQRAESQNFKDRRPLKKAAEYFSLALRHYRRDFRPYLFLSYIFLLHNKAQEAQKYFAAAQNLAPDDPLVAEFKPKIQAAGQTRRQPSAQAFDRADQRLQHVQQQIVEQVQQLSTFAFLPLSAPEPEVADYEKHVQQQQRQYRELVQALNEIEHQVDTHSVRRHLQPLEHYLKLHEARLQVARQCQTLSQELRQLEADVRFGMHYLLEEIAASEKNWSGFNIQLERFLDRLDAMADDLDNIEEQGYDVAPFAQEYERVAPTIEHYVELLDTHSQS